MNRIISCILIVLASASPRLSAEVPHRIAQQGRLVVGNANFHGSGAFKFMLYTGSEGGAPAPVWSNASTSPADMTEPATAVTLNVSRGLYSVFLGDTGLPNMAALPDSIEPPAGERLFLRIWVDAGGGFEPLSPDQPVAAAAFALHARSVAAGGVDTGALSDGAVTAAKIAAGAVSQLGTPDGSDPAAVQVTDEGHVGLGTSDPVAGLNVTGSVDRPDFEIVHVLQDGVNGFDLLAGANAVAIAGNLLVVGGAQDNSVSLIDVTDPAAPILVNTLTDGATVNGFIYSGLECPHEVILHGNLLAVSSGREKAVTLVDIGDPAAPVLNAVFRDGQQTNGMLYDALDFPSGLAMKNGLLAISAGNDDAVNLIDITNPSTPLLRAVLRDGQVINGDLYDGLDFPNDVALSGDLLAVSSRNDDSVTLVDISDPALPELKSVLQDGVVLNGFLFDALEGADGLAFTGDLLAVASSGSDALTLVDVGDPTAPVLLLELRDEEEFDGVHLELDRPISPVFDGDLLAVGSINDRTITMLDVSPSGAPPALALRLGERFDVVSDLALSTDLLAVADSRGTVTLLRRGAAPAGLAVKMRVGIGITAPQAALHVAGDVLVNFARDITLRAGHISLGNGQATGTRAVAMGSGVASGIESTAMGEITRASGPQSLAWGTRTLASGLRAMAGGSGTEALGNNAFAVGSGTVAGGRDAFAAGSGTLARSSFEFALGSFNTDYTPISENGFAPADRLLVIGNGGNNSFRSDALVMLKNGNTELMGELTAEDFTLSAPREFVHRISADGFVPEFGETFDRGTGFIRPTGSNTVLDMLSSVHLPQGATVTKVEFVYLDNDAVEKFDSIIGFMRYTEIDTSTAVVDMADIGDNNTTASATPVLFGDDTINQPVINNTTRQYSLFTRMTVSAIPATSLLRFYGAKITYTLETLLP